MITSTFLTTIYFLIVVGLALYGFNALLLSSLFLWHRHRTTEAPVPEDWPKVTIQLPIFNERFVIERLIDAVVLLDYPPGQLSIQVLDDSTDETAVLAQTRVAHHRARGVNITYLRRADRTGFKAGALAHGLALAPGDFIAVFDADFCPPPGFLRQVMPVVHPLINFLPDHLPKEELLLKAHWHSVPIIRKVIHSVMKKLKN